MRTLGVSLLILLVAAAAHGCSDREQVDRVGSSEDSGQLPRPTDPPQTRTAASDDATPTLERATPTPTDDDDRPQPTPASTPACGQVDGLLGQSTVQTVQSGNSTREFRLVLPEDPGEAFNGPVVLNFHGLGSNMNEQEAYSGLAPIALREGFVLVSPNGTGQPRSWAAFENLPNGVNDIQFVRDLLSTLEDEFCIDTSAVYSTGMSNGAFMSSRLACVLGDRITAIAPVAGVYFPRVAQCGERVSVLAFHGTLDGVVPYEGGIVLGVLPYAGVEAGVYGWAEHNGCEPFPRKDESLADDVRIVAFEGCGGGTDTQLVVVDGGGHTWPGAPEVPALGPTTQSISAAEMIWEFFTAHPPD